MSPNITDNRKLRKKSHLSIMNNEDNIASVTNNSESSGDDEKQTILNLESPFSKQPVATCIPVNNSNNLITSPIKLSSSLSNSSKSGPLSSPPSSGVTVASFLAHPTSFKRLIVQSLQRAVKAFTLGYAIRTLFSIIVRIIGLARSNPRGLLNLDSVVGQGAVKSRIGAFRLGLSFGCYVGVFQFLNGILRLLLVTDQENNEDDGDDSEPIDENDSSTEQLDNCTSHAISPNSTNIDVNDAVCDDCSVDYSVDSYMDQFEPDAPLFPYSPLDSSFVDAHQDTIDSSETTHCVDSTVYPSTDVKTVDVKTVVDTSINPVDTPPDSKGNSHENLDNSEHKYHYTDLDNDNGVVSELPEPCNPHHFDVAGEPFDLDSLSDTVQMGVRDSNVPTQTPVDPPPKTTDTVAAVDAVKTRVGRGHGCPLPPLPTPSKLPNSASPNPATSSVSSLPVFTSPTLSSPSALSTPSVSVSSNKVSLSGNDRRESGSGRGLTRGNSLSLIRRSVMSISGSIHNLAELLTTPRESPTNSNSLPNADVDDCSKAISPDSIVKVDVRKNDSMSKIVSEVSILPLSPNSPLLPIDSPSPLGPSQTIPQISASSTNSKSPVKKSSISTSSRPRYLLPDGLITALAGAVAGVSLLLQPAESRRMVALYMFARALQSLYLHARAMRFLPDIPLGGETLFALSNGVIMYCYTLQPDHIAESFFRFIEKTGPIAPVVMHATRSINDRVPFDTEPVKSYIRKNWGKGPRFKWVGKLLWRKRWVGRYSDLEKSKVCDVPKVAWDGAKTSAVSDGVKPRQKQMQFGSSSFNDDSSSPVYYNFNDTALYHDHDHHIGGAVGEYYSLEDSHVPSDPYNIHSSVTQAQLRRYNVIPVSVPAIGGSVVDIDPDSLTTVFRGGYVQELTDTSFSGVSGVSEAMDTSVPDNSNYSLSVLNNISTSTFVPPPSPTTATKTNSNNRYFSASPLWRWTAEQVEHKLQAEAGRDSSSWGFKSSFKDYKAKIKRYVLSKSRSIRKGSSEIDMKNEPVVTALPPVVKHALLESLLHRYFGTTITNSETDGEALLSAIRDATTTNVDRNLFRSRDKRLPAFSDSQLKDRQKALDDVVKQVNYFNMLTDPSSFASPPNKRHSASFKVGDRTFKFAFSDASKSLLTTPRHTCAHHHYRLPCWALHPQLPHSCGVNFVGAVLDTGYKLLPLYTAVQLVPLLLFKNVQVLRHPLRYIPSALIGILRSCTFIGAFVGFYNYFVCFHRAITPLHLTESPLALFMSGIFTGYTSIFCERAKRRTELGLYVFPRALDAFISILRERRLLPKPLGNNIQIENLAIWSLSLGVVSYFFFHQPANVSSLVYTIMKQITGVDPLKEQQQQQQQQYHQDHLRQPDNLTEKQIK